MTGHNNVNGAQHANRDRINILVVGDDLNEVMEINRELKQANIAYLLHVVGDSAEAMTYLLQQQPYTSAPRPDLVLLHVNLPTHTRIEFLNGLADHPGIIDTNAVGFTGPGLLDGNTANGVTVSGGQEQGLPNDSWLMRRIAAARGKS